MAHILPSGGLPAGKLVVTFDTKPFAEGKFRFVYLGKWTEHGKKPGKQCVVKKLKTGYNGAPFELRTTLIILDETQILASKFNSELQKFGLIPQHMCLVCFTEGHVVKAKIDSEAHGSPALAPHSTAAAVTKIKNDESLLAEDYLSGVFKKWCNNAGYVSQEARPDGVDSILASFMHWTWHYNNGRLMVGDIQGVKTTTCNNHGELIAKYMLTDPAIMSIDGNYGPTDTGVEGMMMFFLTHECTNVCKSLNKPAALLVTATEFEAYVPGLMQWFTQTCQTHDDSMPQLVVKQIQDRLIPYTNETATKYSHELPAQLDMLAEGVLKQVLQVMLTKLRS